MNNFWTIFVCSIWKYLYKLANTYNTTIIITTHYIEEVRNSKMVGVMRKGTLLVEDDPIALMKQHNATLLEEVVLNICRLDRHNRRKSYEIETQQLESVTVPKKENKSCKCFPYKKSSKTKSEHVNSFVCVLNYYINVTIQVVIMIKNTITFFLDLNFDYISDGLAKPVQTKDKSVRRNKTGESSIAVAVTRSVQRTFAYAEIVWSNFIHDPV